MRIIVDYAVNENCQNPWESMWQICVGCGCCSDDPLKSAKAKLALHERLLDEALSFSLWSNDPELREVQKKNNEENIRWSKEKISEYKKLIAELEANNG